VSSDHGVSPVPEYLKLRGIEGGRINDKEIIEAASKALTATFGEGNWVPALVNDQLYIDQNLIAERKLDAAQVERVAGQAALGIQGIVDYYTRTQIIEDRLGTAPIPRRVAAGFDRQRSGDVWLIARPFTFIGGGGLGTTHGSPYDYDTHVPIFL